jgi:hypothetical protein
MEGELQRNFGSGVCHAQRRLREDTGPVDISKLDIFKKK